MRLFVIGAGEHPDPRWEQLAAEQPNLAVEHCATTGAALGKIAAGDAEPALLARGAVLLDRDVAAAVGRAMADPGLQGVRWGMLASDGIDLTGRRIDAGNYPDAPGVPSRGPVRALATADPGLCLVVPELLRSLPAMPESIAALVAAGWDHGWGSFASPFLRFSSAEDRIAYLDDTALPAEKHHPPVDLATQRRRLDAVRPAPSVTIAIRTTLTRPLMLARTLASIAAQGADEVLLVGAATSGDVAAAADAAGSDHPGLPIRPVIVTESAVPPRTAGTIAALEEAGGDYVWFIDDDDCALTHGLDRIAAAVHGTDRPILVAASYAYEETWEGEGSGARLVGERFVRRYDPHEWFRAFTGWNFLPNCSVAVPREAARARLADVPLRHDLGEDYALQILLYTAPGATVTVIDEAVARVSVRPGGDNVVTMADRDPWLRSIGSFFADLSADERSAAMALWAMGEELRALPYRVDRVTPGEAAVSDPSPAAPQGAAGDLVSGLRRFAGRVRASLRSRRNRSAS